MIIFAVDPGVKNMGYACFDTEKCAFLTFGKFDMQTGVKRVDKTKYALLTKRFCDSMNGLLEKSDVILIEAQMQAKMKMIQTALQCFYWGKSKIIGPLAVRKFFDISMSNYRLNKKTSIELAPLLIRTSKEKALMSSFDKKDDVSDAIILAKYWDLKSRGETWTMPTSILQKRKERNRSTPTVTKKKKRK